MTADVLLELDGYMSAAGYDTDHPWRVLIATERLLEVVTQLRKEISMTDASKSAPPPPAQPKALHQAFSWLPESLKGDRQAEFLAMTQTICAGVATCLELVQQNELARDNGRAPLLGIQASEKLLMLATASAKMLANNAEEHIDFIIDRATNEASA